jgi:hypothetical protein
MPRNLNRRVEVRFPVSSPRLVARVRNEILETYLADQYGARYMQSDGTYTRKSREGGLDSQAWFLGQRGYRPGAVGNVPVAAAIIPGDIAQARPSPQRPACFLVESTNRPHVERLIAPAADDEKTVMAALISRFSDDLARYLVSVAEDICKHTLYETERPAKT